MSEVKLPSVGRIVHYFPDELDRHCRYNGTTCVPAIVVQEFGSLTANLLVFAMNPDGNSVLRYSIRHKSEVEGVLIASYWDWPAIK